MFKLRKRPLALLLVLLLVLLGLHLRAPHAVDPLSSVELEKHDHSTRQRYHFSNYKFSLADDITSDWQSFAAKPQADKCHAFFSVLDEKWPQWEVSPLRGKHFDKDMVRKESYIRRHFKSLLSDKRSRDDTSDQRQKVFRMFDQAVESSAKTEQEMADTMTILRMIGHCFFSDPSAPIPDNLQDIYTRYAHKAAPFFAVPQAVDVSSASGWFSGRPTDGNALDFYYKNMEGSGIVLSTATKHSRDIAKLIHTLRALGNTLPIEIVYKGDLSTKAKSSLKLAATASKEDLLGPTLSDESILSGMFDRLQITKDSLLQLEFPKQDLKFVNVRNSVQGLITADFSGYNNKILALFFSSFEKVLFLDTDTVPLVKPESILAMQEFTSTGAYFFKDRSLSDYNDWVETNFFAKMMPHEHSAVDVAMGIKPVTEHTMGNALMTGSRHLQEAGLFAFDKRKHFRSLLHLFPLALWGEPTKSSVWGDKEFYWLAMSMSGNEEYTFNEHTAASVGEVTKNEYMLFNATKAIEVCSSHPGHISKDGELLWINSGFSYCKKNNFSRDRNKFPATKMPNKNVMNEVYSNPLVIRQAVVPPDVPKVRPINGPADQSSEIKWRQVLKRRKKNYGDDNSQEQISTYDPQKGWTRSAVCTSYHYCAYTAVESFTKPGTLDNSGLAFDFPEEKTQWYDILGAIWLSSLRAPSLSTDEPEPTKAPEGKKDKTKEQKVKEEAKAEKEQPKLEKVDFDPSEVRERPKKLEGIEDALKKLLSGGDKS